MDFQGMTAVNRPSRIKARPPASSPRPSTGDGNAPSYSPGGAPAAPSAPTAPITAPGTSPFTPPGAPAAPPMPGVSGVTPGAIERALGGGAPSMQFAQHNPYQKGVAPKAINSPMAAIEQLMRGMGR